MNKIDLVFEKLRGEKRCGLMPFLVAGFPNFNSSLSLLKLLAQHSDFLEIGFPYSDPLADGPIIQKADQVALRAGSTSDYVFKLISKLRETTKIPITVLVYANLIYQRGVNKFYSDAKAAGIDGVLIPDIPFEEMDIFVKAAKKNNVANIYLLSSSTSEQRLVNILKVAEGYLYLTSIVGITGVKKDIPQDTLDYIKKLKKKTKLPVAVGFGISNSTQVKKLKKAGANGVIMGSSLIQLIQRSPKVNRSAIVGFLERFKI